MSTKTIHAIFTSTLALLVGGLAAVSLNWVSRAQTVSVSPAYTLDQVERLVLADGTERFRFVRSTARRQDGSKAVKEQRFYKANGVPWMMPALHLYDTTARKLISVYPRVSAKITSQLKDNKRESLMRVAQSCELKGFTTRAETETIGFQNVILREGSTPSGSDGLSLTQHQEWVVPALGCLVLKKEIRVMNADGTLRGTTFVDFVSLKVGEPEASYFTVPDGMTEMTPSQVMMAQHRQEGKECKECERSLLDRADRYYHSNPPTQ